MTDFMNANSINDLIRGLFSWIDRAAYLLLGWMYEILFNVASADIFSNATIKNFYGRIQLILGVFMIFRLAITIIKGILNPDTFTDKKSGFGNVITRVITALVLLAVLTPINIPSARTEYEIQLNNNGLLFGTLYSLQTRILENNTLGRLILGTTDNATGGPSGPSTSDNTLTGADKQAKKLEQSADIFTSTILKGFVRINVKSDGDKDETNPESRVCEYIDQATLDAYTAYDADPNEILALVNASCETQGGAFEDILATYKRLTGKDKYIFAYLPIVSTVVAVIFIWILLGEIITIAIRSIKLAVLRLIAPIPIISYIQPSKDGGSFGAWTKALTSTYLELFLHLAVIYFIIFLIQDMIVNGIVINTGTGIIGIFSMIFIWIGMFFFIRQAPKFIMNVLGIKSAGSNIGLAAIMGGTAMAMGGGGAAGFALGALNGSESATKAFNQGKAYGIGDSWNQNSDLMAKIKTGDKDAQGGFLGRMHDRLDYGAREKRAGQLGIGRNAMAAAKYEQDVWDARAAELQKQTELAKMDYENASAGDKAVARDKYEKLYDAYQAAQTRAGKAKKTVDSMEKDRGYLHTTPRTIDVRTQTYRSGRKVHTDDTETTYTYKAGAAGDVDVQYKGVAVDEQSARILDGQGDVSIDKAHRDRKSQGQHYTYESDVKEGYQGLRDDDFPFNGRP